MTEIIIGGIAVVAFIVYLFELLIGDTIGWLVLKPFRIIEEINFGAVEAGDIGGYVEKEDNLSENGNAWVRGNARVYGDARVYGNAMVSGNLAKGPCKEIV